MNTKNTKFCPLNGLEISYQEVNPNAQNVVLFIHGNSSSKTVFKHQLSSKLFENFRLIAFDLPGHGESSRSSASDAYSIPWYSKILSSFIDKMNLNNVILAGHSLGGHVAMGSCNHPSVVGLAIWHSPPLNQMADAAKGFNQTPHFNCYVSASVTRKELENYFKDNFINKNNFEDFLYTDYESTHSDCRIKLGESVKPEQSIGDIDRLNNLNFPYLVLTADQEIVINDDYIKSLNLKMWKDKMISVPNASHYPQIDNPGEFNKVLLEYLTALLA